MGEQTAAVANPLLHLQACANWKKIVAESGFFLSLKK